MQDGTEELTSNLNTSITDSKTYLSTTGKHVDTIFNVNYNEFESTTFTILNNSSQIVFDELASYSKAVSMTEISNIVTTVPDIIKNLKTLTDSTKTLRVYASQLNDGWFIL